MKRIISIFFTLVLTTQFAVFAQADDSVGVKECDDFFTKYEKCISSKVPEAQRETFQTAMKQSKASFKQAAATEAGKAAVAQSCTQSLEAIKKSLAAFSCEW